MGIVTRAIALAATNSVVPGVKFAAKKTASTRVGRERNAPDKNFHDQQKKTGVQSLFSCLLLLFSRFFQLPHTFIIRDENLIKFFVFVSFV